MLSEKPETRDKNFRLFLEKWKTNGNQLYGDSISQLLLARRNLLNAAFLQQLNPNSNGLEAHVPLLPRIDFRKDIWDHYQEPAGLLVVNCFPCP